MDETDYEEIISLLAKNGRPDLIQSFKEAMTGDPEWTPSLKEKNDLNNEEGEYDSDIGEPEHMIVGQTEDGFYYLTSDSE
tara:strand:+ start:8354 stop:8593 length:240 start_codon:yes stop_codon:yes gene_type:complete